MVLMPSLKHDENSNRLFDEQSKNWLIGIKNLRGSGMYIQAVKDYVNLCLQQKKKLEEQLKEMNERYQYIEHNKPVS